MKLGFVGVKNRNQEEVTDEKPVTQALEDEKNYFATHPIYGKMNPAYFGVQNLSKKLMEILEDRITAYLPSIKETVKGKLLEVRTILSFQSILFPSFMDANS